MLHVSFSSLSVMYIVWYRHIGLVVKFKRKKNKRLNDLNASRLLFRHLLESKIYVSSVFSVPCYKLNMSIGRMHTEEITCSECHSNIHIVYCKCKCVISAKVTQVEEFCISSHIIFWSLDIFISGLITKI